MSPQILDENRDAIAGHVHAVHHRTGRPAWSPSTPPSRPPPSPTRSWPRSGESPRSACRARAPEGRHEDRSERTGHRHLRHGPAPGASAAPYRAAGRRADGREAYLAAGGGSPTGGEWAWNAHRVTWVRDDCVVKVPRSAYGEAALRRELSVRTCIHTRPAWPSWRPSRPHAGGARGRRPLRRRRGAAARRAADGPRPDEAVMAAVRAEVARRSRATAHEVLADDWVPAWFLAPAATVSTLLRRWGQRPGADSVTRWAYDVAASLEGRTCRVALVHGDLWPGNILLRRGAGLRIHGLGPGGVHRRGAARPAPPHPLPDLPRAGWADFFSDSVLRRLLTAGVHQGSWAPP